MAAWAADFDAEMAAFQAVWEKRWADAFTPGNGHFSGHLPILKTDDAALRRNYYMGALTMLILERTQFPVNRAVSSRAASAGRASNITGMPPCRRPLGRYWNRPGMKAVLRRWLVQNPRGSPHISLRDAQGFDAKHYDKMSGYAANACTIFQTTDTYLRTTADLGFLDEKLENGKTVLENLDALAIDWETLPRGPEGLVNYGGPGSCWKRRSSTWNAWPRSTRRMSG